MKKDDLKIRQIKDQQVFDNIPTTQAGLMGSGGCGGCGRRANIALHTSIYGSASLGGHSWNYTGQVDLYSTIDIIPTSGSDVRYSITSSISATIQLTGTNSCSTDGDGKRTCINGNTVTRTTTFSTINNCMPFDVSGNLGSGQFTVGKTTYDKEGNITGSTIILSQKANIIVRIKNISYNTETETAECDEPEIDLMPTL